MDLNFEALKTKLKQGKYLEVNTGGGVFEVWAEPYGNPPGVYYEGERYPIEEIDAIVQRILDAMAAGEVTCRWVED